MQTSKLMVAVLVTSGCLVSSVIAADATNAVDKTGAELKRVNDAGKYAVLLFHRKGDDSSAVREAVKKVVDESKGRAEAVEAEVSDPASAGTVSKYSVSRAPLPLVLAVAPNGAVTGGFPGKCDPKALSEAMFGPKAATCLKTLQEGKVVLVCVQNATSKNAEAALKTVSEFKADQRISEFAESVVIDPADQAENGFLGKLRVDPKSGVATTVLVVPPGRIVGTYTNLVTKEAMFADLARAMQGSTCGSGGCGPSSGGCR